MSLPNDRDDGGRQSGDSDRRTGQAFIEWATSKLSREERRQLHDELSGQRFTEEEILDLIETMFGPDKRPDRR